MKHVSSLVYLFTLFALFSCKIHVPEIKLDLSGPCGIMYLDDIELKEACVTYPFYAYPYGPLELWQREDGGFRHLYFPDCFRNSDDTVVVHFLYCFENVSKEQFDSGTILFSYGDDVQWLEFSINNMHYGVSTLDISFSDVEVIQTSSNGTQLMNVRIDYQMEVVDPEGATHYVHGWAIPREDREPSSLF